MALPEKYFEKINSITNVSRETFNFLETFIEELLKWNKKINLISKSHSSPDDIWQRHIMDSAQLIKYIPPEAKTIIDFGSGGGFPALVMALLTDCKIHLVESDQRKCAFLAHIKNACSLDIIIHNKRVEQLDAIESDIITARALAPLPKLIELTQPFINKTKLCIFLKGQNVVEEIEEASKYWDMRYELFPSISDAQGNILVVNHIAKKEG